MSLFVLVFVICIVLGDRTRPVIYFFSKIIFENIFIEFFYVFIIWKSLLSRPTGYSEIVGFSPENPGEFLSSREQYYDECCTYRIKFPAQQDLSESISFVKEKLFDKDLKLYKTTRSENGEFDFPTVALSGSVFKNSTRYKYKVRKLKYS